VSLMIKGSLQEQLQQENQSELAEQGSLGEQSLNRGGRASGKDQLLRIGEKKKKKEEER